MAKREIYCPYCGKGPYSNKGSLRSHFRRCQRLPASGVPEIKDNSETAEEYQQSEEFLQLDQNPQTPPTGETETIDPPPGVDPVEFERQIQALVDARVQSMMSQAEERLSTMMSQSIGMIEQTCEKLPGLVEKQVQTMLGGQEQVVVDQDNPMPQEHQQAQSPLNGRGQLGAFGGIDWLRIAAEFLGADPNDPASIIAAVLKKSQQSQKKAEPLNASMMSRGAAHMISMLKNKRVDPISAARVALTMSEDILKMPGIDGSTKSYWIGRKSEAANYLAMLQMEADNKAASAGAE
ncbi:MAG: hypothetical protein ACRKGH_03795 [Dehalogenimonas sp.]